MKKILFLFLIPLSFLVQASTEFKIITLQHSFASDLLPIIDPMVGTSGTATGIRNQLILRASPDRMREIEAVVKELDVVRVNRKITVNTNSNILNQRESIEASGKVKVGKVAISNNRHAKINSGSVDFESSSNSRQRHSSQFLNVLDGERAFIRVGQIVPFTQEWVTITSRYIRVDRITDWNEVSTGFAVRPRTIGDQVELEITPRIARVNSNGYIDFEELSTIVRISLGEWVDIGGAMQANDNLSRKILGYQQSSSHHNTSLIVKID